MKLDKESYDKVIQALEAADVEPFRYSGRNMGGRDCVGAQVYDALEFAMELAVSVCENASDTGEAKEILEALTSPKSDSLGRQGVIYWPSLEWQEPEDGEDEDGEEIEVNTEDYEGAHGHEPGGLEGQWMFYLGEAGEECPESLGDKKLFSHNGSYAQAKKAAVAAAKEQGKGTVFVLS